MAARLRRVQAHSRLVSGSGASQNFPKTIVPQLRTKELREGFVRSVARAQNDLEASLASFAKLPVHFLEGNGKILAGLVPARRMCGMKSNCVRVDVRLGLARKLHLPVHSGCHWYSSCNALTSSQRRRGRPSYP